MVNAAFIQKKLDRGNGRLATKMGESCVLYRATDYQTMTQIYNSIFVYFDPSPNFKGAIWNGYGHPVWAATLDRTTYGLLTGDYLQGSEGTFFIIALQSELPSAVVSCNRVISVYRPEPNAPSANFRLGQIGTGSTKNLGRLIMSNFPCSILQGTKGEKEDAGLPLANRSPWASILLPDCNPQPFAMLNAFGGVVVDDVQPPVINDTIKTSDLIVDDLGRRWSVSSVELTDLGYKISCAYAGE